MSKSQRGNKEPKKPKRVQSTAKPISPSALPPAAVPIIARDRLKTK
jgi:hypothetical protein